MKKKYTPIILFGLLLASLAISLKFIEYRYIVGSLSRDFYTTVVATIFTGVGTWIGINFLKKNKKSTGPAPEINHQKLKELQLNDREYEILQLLAKGLTNQEIADQLFLALPTIKTHTSNLYIKLDVQSRTKAIHKAQTLNLI